MANVHKYINASCALRLNLQQRLHGVILPSHESVPQIMLLFESAQSMLMLFTPLSEPRMRGWDNAHTTPFLIFGY